MYFDCNESAEDWCNENNYKYELVTLMTITELIKDLETIKLCDGDLDLWDKITIKSIHDVAIGKDKFQIFNIPIEYI